MAIWIRRDQIIRLTRLLDMMYRPSELAAEVHISTDTIYRKYLSAGCPFERDSAGNIWIHGLAYAAWARKVVKRNKLISLADNEAFCLKCRAATPLIRPRLRHQGRYTKIYQGKCGTCGTKVNRAYAASAEVAQ